MYKRYRLSGARSPAGLGRTICRPENPPDQDPPDLREPGEVAPGVPQLSRTPKNVDTSVSLPYRKHLSRLSCLSG
jgi:hypothetical protein